MSVFHYDKGSKFNIIGLVILTERTKQDLTVRKLADKSLVNYSHISRMENGVTCNEATYLDVLNTLEVDFITDESILKEQYDMLNDVYNSISQFKLEISKDIMIDFDTRYKDIYSLAYLDVLLCKYIYNVYLDLKDVDVLGKYIDSHIKYFSDNQVNLYNHYQAFYMYKSNNFKGALELFDGILKRTSYKSDGMLEYNMGIVLHRSRNYVRALDCFKIAEEKFKNTNIVRYIYCQGYIGSMYSSLKQYDISIERLNKVLSMLEQLNDDYNILYIYQTLSRSYLYKGNYNECYRYADLCVTIEKEFYPMYYYKLVSLLALNEIDKVKELITECRINIKDSTYLKLIEFTEYNIHGNFDAMMLEDIIAELDNNRGFEFSMYLKEMLYKHYKSVDDFKNALKTLENIIE